MRAWVSVTRSGAANPGRNAMAMVSAMALGPDRSSAALVDQGVAAECVERAWISSPTHVLGPVTAGPPHRAGINGSGPATRQTPARSVPSPTVNPTEATVPGL
jgi:hypothetical protein